MRHKVVKGTLLAVLLVGSGFAVIGQTSSGDMEAGKRWLVMMNKPGDTDKTISKQEFDRYLNEQFDKADTDHDGTLDAAELGHLRAELIAK